MARLEPQTYHQAPLQSQMTEPGYRRNALHEDGRYKSSTCMAVVSVCIVIEILRRVVMGLCVELSSSLFLSWPGSDNLTGTDIRFLLVRK